MRRETMTECKIITINDGKERQLTNGNYLYACDYPVLERYLNEYLEEGWKVIHMLPEFEPAINEKGNYSFYKGGYTFYLEREI